MYLLFLFNLKTGYFKHIGFALYIKLRELKMKRVNNQSTKDRNINMVNHVIFMHFLIEVEI